MKRIVLMLALAAFACSPLLTTEASAAPAKHHVKHHKKHHRKHHKHVKHHTKHKVA